MCTDFLLQAADASVVNGRSMEYGLDMGSQIVVGGRGTPMTSGAPGLPNGGLGWVANFGYVGLNVAGLGHKELIADGMNQEGLAISALWLPGYTVYSHTVTDNAVALDVSLLPSWALGKHATVDEFRAELEHVEIWAPDSWNTEIPLHFSIHDATGQSAVLEFLVNHPKGEVTENPVGVLTNAPPFDWQVSNIGNYVGLTSLDAAPITIGSEDYFPPGHGSGMRGLPGDSTPPSRFVKTVFQKQFATQPEKSTDASSLALHLLNTVDIPRGTSTAQKASAGDDHTQWVVVKALTAKTFSYRTASNPTVMQINFADLDLDDPVEATYPMPSDEPTFIDITGKLRPPPH
jgi:choloylglycine hydrolase